ncbi:SDR family oxidoreductase [Rickettsiales bacterium]|nr:SDR family oxidoreductase [Rickettsiales bacterium]
MQKHIFIFGLGYTATHLAKRLLDDGWRVSGTCRSEEKSESLRPLGITPYIFDIDLPLQNPWDLSSVTHILISIPPDEKEGDIVYKYHLEDLKNLPDLQWVGYLSTTGVYGDHNGQWVDEKSQLRPNNDRLKRRVEAEEDWSNSSLPVNIFRLSGIYGPNRSAIDNLKAGTARRISKPGQFFSRIHVDDIATTLIASMNNIGIIDIYNVADDMPAAQEEVVFYAANLLDVKAPDLVDFEDANLSPMARSFYMGNRRVSNKKIKDELGVELKYPSYKEGLQSCIV